MIGEEGRIAVIARPHRIGIGLAGQPRRREAVANLDPLDRIDAHHRRGEFAVELRIERSTPPRR